MSDYSYVFNAHPSYIESMYKKYLSNPSTIEDGWRVFFEGFEFGFEEKSQINSGSPSLSTKEFGVISLIQAYRSRGHLLSTTNPIFARRDRKPHLALEDHNLSDKDLNSRFIAGKIIGLENETLESIIEKLKKIYIQNIGFEYTYIDNKEIRSWLQEQIETQAILPSYGIQLEQKKRILQKLNGAVVFEKFLHTKYVGQKRFSLEGGETTIAALDAIINKASDDKVEEVVIGMAHRGRLNVLANVLGKTYEQIFNEFEGTAILDLSFGDGDVKYHVGYSSQIETASGKKIHLKLAPNPSHLESVNPVVEGFSRAKADILYESDYDRILPILIHGDAAIAGQGVVYETTQMSQLDGYFTGGTIHFIINNQIGFTTNWDDARSSTYCTGVAKIIQAPVFHVNGDDPEAVVFAVELATAYRQKYNKDVFIDMVCYRRHGHNEGDDPKFTQPRMYDIISKHPNPREVYIKKLLQQDQIQKQLAEEMEEKFWSFLQARLDMVKQKQLAYEYQEPEQAWRSLKKTRNPLDFEVSPITGIHANSFDHVINHLMSYPEGFTPLDKIKRLQKAKTALLGKNKMDWALAELLAYASILLEGNDVRISGQDVKRGTFSHRHAIFRDAKSFKSHNRLEGLGENQGKFRIFNSLLSEFGVLGFEYGYSLATPHSLVIWEGQFGDFYNGAQTIVDQYIVAGESKWQRMSGLVLLLPHGYEGQGPEHSSGRMERFLQSCAEYNMSVVNITSPANFFHVIRRQLQRPFRKPLIVMSPKSLLRHPSCISSHEEFIGETRFREVIDEDHVDANSIKKVLLCSGKIYYELAEFKEKNNRLDVSIVRVEQLYPFPEKQINHVFKKYGHANFVWVQEEPGNMGAWQYILSFLHEYPIKSISRKTSASPATGFKGQHDQEQNEILQKAFS